MINVHGGGTLHQHVAPHACFDRPPNSVAHRVDLTAGSLVASIYGPSVHVNSLHHQAVDRVADGYEVTGRSNDGTIEALESSERPWLGSAVAPRDARLPATATLSSSGWWGPPRADECGSA